MGWPTWIHAPQPDSTFQFPNHSTLHTTNLNKNKLVGKQIELVEKIMNEDEVGYIFNYCER